MRRRRLVVIAVVPVIVIAAAAVVVWAQQQEACLSPDRILKGTAPTITITLDKSIQEIKSVRVGGQDGVVQQPIVEGKVLVQLPRLDIVGRADVEVIGKDDKPVLVGHLTYVESAEPSALPVLGYSRGLVLLLVYVVLIVLLPIWATIYDIYKSYEERKKVFDRLRPHATTEETRALLKDMDQGPTGLVGLTRGLVALTLILVLAFAAFHLTVFAPPKLPDIADKLLMLIAGTLTAITGFYFGSRAATEAATAGAAAATSQTAPSAGGAQGSGTPKILGINPEHPDTTNTTVTLIGDGFGEQQGRGTVTFGGKHKEADVKDWKDKQIEVTVPPGLPPGKPVDIVVTNDKGSSSAAYQITIAAAPHKT